MLALDVRDPLFDPQAGKRCFPCLAIFLPVTFGAQRKITHPITRSTSVSKIDLWNVKLRFRDKSKMEGICGNVRYNTHLYCLAVQPGLYSDVVECWLRMLEVLGLILSRGKSCLAFFHLLHVIR